jgi:hypothetical protein
MTAFRIACAAAAATLPLFGGCDRPRAATPPVAAAPASAVQAAAFATEPDTVVAVESLSLKPGRGGFGIRPTGTSANGISP